MHSVKKGLAAMQRNHLAIKVGVSKSMVSRVLNGQCDPSLRVAQKMAREIGCSLDDLVIYIRTMQDEQAAA